VSDMSQGPGWWIASDDKWYPPHLHPSVRIPETSETDRDDVTDWSPTATEPSVAADVLVNPPGAPPVTEKPGKRSRTPIAAAVGILVVILLVVGAVVVFGNTESASAKVINAVDSTISHRTAHVTMSLTGTAQGTRVTGTGSGSIDFTNNAVQLQMTVDAGSQQVPISAIFLSGQIYETIPGLDTIAPGKSWLSIDLSALQQEEEQNPSTQALSNNPTVMLQMLAQQGNTVVPLGRSTVNGVAVNGYSVTVDPSSIAQKIKSANLPSWLQQAVAGMKVQDAGIRVFIDDAGNLRSFAIHMQTTGASGATTVDETLDLLDYGTPVDISAPPAGQVESFEQLLQTAGPQGTATS
jgi:hypothetical protein